MGKRTNDAERANNILRGITELKQLTNTPNFKKVSISAIASKYGLGSNFASAIIKLSLIEKGPGGSNVYRWSAGARAVDINLANIVYDKMKVIQNTAKSKVRSLNDVKDKLDTREKPNGENKSPEKVNKSTEDGALKGKTSSTPKHTFDPKLGTIFGLKQLSILKEWNFKGDTTVQLMDTQTLYNIRHLKFLVEQSKLTIEFHNSVPNNTEEAEVSIVSKFELNNTVIGVAENDKGFRLTLIAVTNPYELH